MNDYEKIEAEIDSADEITPVSPAIEMALWQNECLQAILTDIADVSNEELEIHNDRMSDR